MALSANHDYWVESLAQLLADTFPPELLRDVILGELSPLRRRAVERATVLAEENAIRLSMRMTVEAERLGLVVGPPAEQLGIEP